MLVQVGDKSKALSRATTFPFCPRRPPHVQQVNVMISGECFGEAMVARQPLHSHHPSDSTRPL